MPRGAVACRLPSVPRNNNATQAGAPAMSERDFGSPDARRGAYRHHH